MSDDAGVKKETTMVVLSKEEIELLERKNTVRFEAVDGEVMLEHEKTFVKFLNKCKFAFELELGKWLHRWKEEKLYNYMECIDEVIKSVKSVEKSFVEYQKQKEKQEKKEDKKEANP